MIMQFYFAIDPGSARHLLGNKGHSPTGEGGELR